MEKEILSAEDAAVPYKTLSQVELAFRSWKGIDLHVRPIRHRTEDHARAHFFLCMLPYYVEFRFQKAQGFTVHSLETALAELGTRCRHTCSTPGSQGMSFTMETEWTPWRQKVFALLKAYPVPAKTRSNLNP